MTQFETVDHQYIVAIARPQAFTTSGADSFLNNHSNILHCTSPSVHPQPADTDFRVTANIPEQLSINVLLFPIPLYAITLYPAGFITLFYFLLYPAFLLLPFFRKLSF